MCDHGYHLPNECIHLPCVWPLRISLHTPYVAFQTLNELSHDPDTAMLPLSNKHLGGGEGSEEEEWREKGEGGEEEKGKRREGRN